ncbi:hypothetical protein QZH41_012531 [Actinostola sp. cb2023]|nr:hypothetical protein QZH41_012531 [Actinostola sp. cb2023]
MDESLDVSEIEANPQQYNPLQPVNYYGSPIALPGTSEDTNDEVLTRAVNFYGSPIASNSTNPGPRTAEDTNNEVRCSCKNTCSRKRSARTPGCPCQNAGKKCSDQCTCGTKKSACRNKAENVVVNRNPSAYARHREAVDNAETEIKEFISTLTVEKKDSLLIRLLSQGRGSVEFAKNILQDVEDPDPDEPSGSEIVPWCVCHVCRPMDQEMENVCCKKRTCVTSYAMFNNICLDREVLNLAIRARCDIRADEPDYATTSYRKAAYRQYCLWKYGKLGRGNRRVLASCVVLTIRRAYPAPDGEYLGFRST